MRVHAHLPNVNTRATTPGQRGGGPGTGTPEATRTVPLTGRVFGMLTPLLPVFVGMLVLSPFAAVMVAIKYREKYHVPYGALETTAGVPSLSVKQVTGAVAAEQELVHERTGSYTNNVYELTRSALKRSPRDFALLLNVTALGVSHRGQQWSAQTTTATGSYLLSHRRGGGAPTRANDGIIRMRSIASTDADQNDLTSVG